MSKWLWWAADLLIFGIALGAVCLIAFANLGSQVPLRPLSGMGLPMMTRAFIFLVIMGCWTWAGVPLLLTLAFATLVMFAVWP